MLINLRNALMSGKRLPYDAEVEFLESTGTQWINTEIVGDSTTTSDMVCMRTLDSTNDMALGCIGSGNTRVWLAFWFSRKYYIGYGSGEGIQIAAPLNEIVNVVTVLDGNTIKLYADGNLLKTKNFTAFDSGRNLYIFAHNNNGTAASFFKGRIFGCKIYKSGILVRDFIPVRKGTVGYMYDRVSGLMKPFGNAGTGNFTLGPDVVPVEWLETTGTQYIDTGVTCGSANTTVFEFDQSYSALQSGRFVWGSDYGANQGKDADNYYVCGLDRSNVVMQTGVVYHCKTQVAPNNAIKAYINGTLFRDNTGSNPYTNPFYIFRLGGYDGVDGKPSCLRIHHLTVSINNALLRSFRPVRVGTDATSWEGAMMDVLTRRIYRNAGTGAFTYGNDLKYPIPAE